MVIFNHFVNGWRSWVDSEAIEAMSKQFVPWSIMKQEEELSVQHGPPKGV